MSTSIYAKKQEISQPLKIKFAKDNNLPNFENTCVFCFAGANQIKKSIGAMIDAFSLADNKEMSLVLALKNVASQIGPFQYEGEYDLIDLISHPNIYVIKAALNNQSHADLFRMSDFLLYPSQGEAPGLQVSEAQLCGCIPIATNYTGLPEESCFPEFLIRDFILHRGQFNCYRAVVDARVLRGFLEVAFDFWAVLNKVDSSDHPQASQRYEQFMIDVELKFRNRSWAAAARNLSDVFQSLQRNDVRVDSELVKL